MVIIQTDENAVFHRSSRDTYQSQQHVIEIPAPQSAERGDASKCIRQLAEGVKDGAEERQRCEREKLYMS